MRVTLLCAVTPQDQVLVLSQRSLVPSLLSNFSNFALHCIFLKYLYFFHIPQMLAEVIICMPLYHYETVLQGCLPWV